MRSGSTIVQSHIGHTHIKANERRRKRLIARIERISSLQELRHLLHRMNEQLGIQLMVQAGEGEVRTVRGLNIRFESQTGLCKKTQQTLPAAIRRALDADHRIVYALLDEHSLLGE